MRLVFIVFTLFIGMISCTKNKAIELDLLEKYPCVDLISYAQVIEPMINQSCNVSGCHNSTASAGYEFTSYDVVSNNATIINKVISRESGVTPMPYGQDQLPDSLIAKFRCWIEQGTLNN